MSSQVAKLAARLSVALPRMVITPDRRCLQIYVEKNSILRVRACVQDGNFRTGDSLGSQTRLPSLFPIMLMVGLQLAAQSSRQIVTSLCQLTAPERRAPRCVQSTYRQESN